MLQKLTMADDDLDELRALSAGRGMTSREEDDENKMAQVMGFSNFGGEKKAKQFDFMAMFEETRRNAMERSQKVLEVREEEDVSAAMRAATVSPDPTTTSDKPTRITQPTKQPAGFKSAFMPAAHPDKKQLQSDDSDDELIGPPIPAGMKTSSLDVPGPPLPQAIHDRLQADMGTTGSDDDDDDDDDDDNPLKKIPSSHEITLDHGNKPVSGLGLDPSGARLVTGGYDYDVKLWDFAGMDRSLQSFRQLRPCESHPIRGLEYSTTGDMILVVSGNSQAKLIDRDGFEVMECTKGDQYIVDQARTKGHTAMLNNGCWHPKIKGEFMTCSNDCTVRLWTVNKEKQHKSIIKTKSTGGRKTIPTACTYSKDGVYVAAASQDGSIQLWDHRKNFVNVAMKNMTAHQNGCDTTCLTFSYDGNLLASRSTDETLKLWDLRNIKECLAEAKGLENHFPATDCVFSPDNQLVMTGTSVQKGHGDGKLVFLDKSTLTIVGEIEAIEGASVARCLWHPRLNQIVAGGGDGNVKVYYDPDKSHRGAKLCVVKKPRNTNQVEMLVAQNIITPYALPMFRQSKPSTTKRQEEKARKDPIKSHRPDLPMSGPGHGGRLGNKGATLAQYVAQTLVKRKPDDRDKDPRAAILRHAEEATKNPFWIDPAYKDTQPVSIFQPTDQEEDGEEGEDQPAWKKQKI